MKTCFVISPIGERQSEIRRHADALLKHVIRPVCEELDYAAERADEIREVDLITQQVMRRVIECDLVIADLSFRNPNVFYELAARHCLGKPTVQLVRVQDQLPFDIRDLRTIRVDLQDLDSVEECKQALKAAITASERAGHTGNPITAAIRTGELTLPIPTASFGDALNQFTQLSQRMTEELRSLREERTLLVSALDKAGADAGASCSGELVGTADISGDWHCLEMGVYTGIYRLHQIGTVVLGEYEYFTDYWFGKLFGEIRGNLIVVQWLRNDGTSSGVSRFQISDTRLDGNFWISDELPPFHEILANLKVLDKIGADPHQEICLTRDKPLANKGS